MVTMTTGTFMKHGTSEKVWGHVLGHQLIVVTWNNKSGCKCITMHKKSHQNKHLELITKVKDVSLASWQQCHVSSEWVFAMLEIQIKTELAHKLNGKTVCRFFLELIWRGLALFECFILVCIFMLGYFCRR